ncbi:hypothetical protein WG66_006450 [Moniliophthora roreri]|nr:hypothetical protein WG66_006450 [Moniliophthora roreri]
MNKVLHGNQDDVKSYFADPGTKPGMSNGIVIVPHDMGFRAVFGSPSRITLRGAVALEVEMGCMPTGMYAEEEMDSILTTDLFDTTEYWKEQTYGDALVQTVDELRRQYAIF